MSNLQRFYFTLLAAVLACVPSVTAGNVRSVDSRAGGVTVYYDNSSTGWNNVNIHYWMTPVTEWPGVAMTRVDDNVWKYTFNADVSSLDGFLFCDGSGSGDANQTVDYKAKPVDGHIYKGAASVGGAKCAVTDEGPYEGYVVPDPGPVVGIQPSGTLPVLYINVRDEAGDYNNEITDKDLAHKNYFAGEYWLDINGCQWMIDEGFASVGSQAEPLPLEIKARGNYSRTAFAKKPFKLKLAKKQSLLGMSKSKHYAILAHADDNFGYLRNFVGFDLGQRIGLPWTPSQQPVEVVINGNYRGLYFLTESIRVGDDRIMVEPLDDNVSDPALVSGGYLVELDNYDEENQIRMAEKYCAGGYHDMLRVTFDTPEVYSDLQHRFINDQFTAMNDCVGRADRSDDLWGYMDLDDAVRYYLVEEIISHVEAYHGSTYLFRDRGEGMKWHFSPLWDCGNAFAGPTDGFIYDNSLFGMTWIASMRCNARFNEKVSETWKWFMTNCYEGLMNDIDAYVAHIADAARCDRNRWKDAPLPVSDNRQAVSDNSDMQLRRNTVVGRLNAKIDWLKNQFGNYGGGTFAEPSRDMTPAVPLPSYARVPDPSRSVTVRFVDDDPNPWAEVYAYIWGPNAASGSENYQALGTWPGVAMTAEAPMARSAASSWTHTFEPEYALDEGSKIIFHNNSGNETASFAVADGNSYNRSGITSGVDEVIGDNDPTERWFNLQGIEIDRPAAPGVYIRLRGREAVKVVL